MKSVLDKCWAIHTGTSHTHSREAGKVSQKREGSTGVLGVETPNSAWHPAWDLYCQHPLTGITGA